jgi:hypothetical protein
MPVELLADLDRALLALGDERASPLTQQAGVELLIDTLDRMREYGLDVDRAVDILRKAQDDPDALKSYAQSMFDLQSERMEQEIRKLQAETELALRRIGLTEAQIEKIKQETINSIKRLQQIDRELRIAEARIGLERERLDMEYNLITSKRCNRMLTDCIRIW